MAQGTPSQATVAPAFIQLSSCIHISGTDCSRASTQTLALIQCCIQSFVFTMRPIVKKKSSYWSLPLLFTWWWRLKKTTLALLTCCWNGNFATINVKNLRKSLLCSKEVEHPLVDKRLNNSLLIFFYLRPNSLSTENILLVLSR